MKDLFSSDERCHRRSLGFCACLLVLLLIETISTLVYAGSLQNTAGQQLLKLVEWAPIWNGCWFVAVVGAICLQPFNLHSHYGLFAGAILISLIPFLADRLAPGAGLDIAFGMFCYTFGAGGVLGALLGGAIGTLLRRQSRPLPSGGPRTKSSEPDGSVN